MNYARVYVEITNRCNRNCSFCHGHSRAPRQMSRDEFARVLEQLSSKTRYLYYHLMGEPLMHPELCSFLEMAKHAGFRSVLTTNGSLLAQKKQALLSAPIYKMNLSLHSFEEGSEAEFVRYLSEVSEFAEEASERGILVVFRLWNRGVDDAKNERIFSFLRQRIPGEWAENTRGMRIHHRLHLEWGDRFAWPDSEAPLNISSEMYCYALRDHFGILADGTVVPCCLDSDGLLRLGNVFESPLDDILTSERARRIAEGFERRRPAENLCLRCGYAQRFKV